MDSQVAKNSQTQVANACNQEFINTGPIILKSISSLNMKIEWLSTIARTPQFLKKDKYQLSCQADYINWLETVVNAKKSKVGLLLTMANPGEALKRATKEDLVGAYMAHEAAKQRAAGKQKTQEGDNNSDDLDDGDLNAVDWERVNIHMDKIYAKNLTKVKYDRHLPVYLDPANPDHYILVTLEACQVWAHALVSHSLFHP